MMRWLPLLFLPGCIDWTSLYQSRCGNGHVESGEECDDANNSDTDACLSTCKWAACGDGHVRAGVEDCDDGNLIDGDSCSSTCLLCQSGDANFLFPENGHCYSRHDETASWGAAELTCDTRNGYLATLVSPHEAQAVEAALLGTVAASTWIGMTDSAMPGSYAWLTYEPVQYSKWSSGTRMQNGCAVERSTPNQSGAPSVEWATAPCDRTLGFVCEQVCADHQTRESPRLPRSLRSRELVRCSRQLRALGRPPGHDRRRSGECFRDHPHTGRVLDRSHGAERCWRRSGDASCPIPDSATSPYQWVTDSSVDATFFAPGEPDHRDCAKCLIMGVDKGWHDRACNNTEYFSPYICETE